MSERRVGRIAFAGAALVLLATSPATAVTMPVRIELNLLVATLAPVPIVSSGAVTLNGSGAGGHLESLSIGATELSGGYLVPITDPASAPITGVRATVANRAGGVAETVGGTLRGAIGLQGVVKVCLFGDGGCSGAIGNINVPLTVVGDGGFQVATGPVNLTVIGAPWTTGTAAIGVITQMGFARGPASLASSTAMPSGTIRLVTPLHISTNIGASVVVPIFAVMEMHFVPEPTTIALLGFGIAALATAGARRV